MSRPHPDIKLESFDPHSTVVTQVITSEGIWAVHYQGKPINIRSMKRGPKCTMPKYKKVAFSNPGHAVNLAKKLNTMYDTTEFNVIELSNGIEYFTETTDNK